MLDNTLLGLIVKNASEMPDDDAMREKRYGVWSPMTWSELQDNVQRFALGLRAMGFEDDNTLAIIGDNKPEWVIAEFGCMAAGGGPNRCIPGQSARRNRIPYLLFRCQVSGG